MLKWLLTGGAVPMLLMGSGAFFLLYLRALPLRRPIQMIRSMMTPTQGSGVSPFRAVMLALAGTLGVGNIVGVANALFLGGPGSILWMWVSALFAMILKYAEILLAVSHRRRDSHGFLGGAYYYIRDAFFSHRMTKCAVFFSSLFALLMTVNALSMGCVIQINAVSSAAQGVMGISPWITGTVLLLLTLPVLLRGSRGISRLTEGLVPAMTVGYLLLSAAVLILKRDSLGPAMASILENAFGGKEIAGGVLGFLTSRALQTGTMRGLLSNEGGCGTAPTAHASANAKSPADQGIWGIFEVFVDTILLCTLTALVILVSYEEVSHLGSDGVMMTIRAYSLVLGGWAEVFFCIAILCFGYATVLCWSGYGLESVSFLSPKKRYRYLYYLLVGGCIVSGAIIAPDRVWILADFSIATLTTLNLLTLILMRREIREETDRWARDAGDG